MKTAFATLAAALLLCTTSLSAAPDHDRRSDRFDRSKHSDRFQRDTTRRVERPDRTVRDVRTIRQSHERTDMRRVREPGTTVIRRTPSRPDGSVRLRTTRPDTHRIYRSLPRFRPLPHHHRPGYVTRILPSAVISLSLGNLLFYYSDGIYYRRHHSAFVVALPPIGLIVPVLPADYVVVRMHGITYYYYADVYYVRDVYHDGYRVVKAPEAAEADYQPGDVLDTLPDGAYSVTIDGVQYYRFHGVYFLQTIQKDRIVYVVVTP